MENDKRAQGDMGLLVYNKYKEEILDIRYVDEHTMIVEIKMKNIKLLVQKSIPK